MELEVKKSRFLAIALPLSHSETGDVRLDEVRCADASHNCWAWRTGDQYRSFDDGEPGGTAGRPILAAIDGAGLDRVLVVVARWFGGIKLGAGGLIRAYGGAAAECLRLAEKLEVLPRERLVIDGGYELLGPLYALSARHDASVLSEQHTPAGARWVVELGSGHRASFIRDLTDASRGQAKVSLLDEC